MRTRIDYPEITNAELNRRGLDQIAAQVKDPRRNANDSADRAGTLPALGERRRLFASLTQMWDAAIERDVEHADPLGVWSYGQPRRPLVRLDTRMALDWGVWTMLVVLAGYLAAGR